VICHRIYQEAQDLEGIDGVGLFDQWEATEASILIYYLDHICASQMSYSESIEKSETALHHSILYEEELKNIELCHRQNYKIE
jgi:hypothetical protein